MAEAGRRGGRGDGAGPVGGIPGVDLGPLGWSLRGLGPRDSVNGWGFPQFCAVLMEL